MSKSSGRERSSLGVLRWATIGFLVAAVALVAYKLLSAPSVQTVTTSRRDIVETLAIVGRVRPPSRAGLGAAIAGIVSEVRVREGDRVGAGDVVVQLDDRESRAAVLEGEAALSGVVASTNQAVEQAEREAEQTHRDLERIRAVRQAGGLTQQQLEQAEQRAADAKSRLESLRAGVGGAEDGEAAAVVRARAALQAARARLALTRIEAPSHGTILTRAVEPGDAVSPGKVLIEMAVDGPVELAVFPGEENLGELQVGAPAVASTDAYPERTFPASVSLIAPGVDPAQGTIEVRLTVPDPPDYLRPEMTVSVNVQTGMRSGAIVLPDKAVQGLGTTRPWLAVVREGRLIRQDVETGLRAEGFIEILSGISPQEPVATGAVEGDLGKRVRIGHDGRR